MGPILRVYRVELRAKHSLDEPPIVMRVEARTAGQARRAARAQHPHTVVLGVALESPPGPLHPRRRRA